MRKLPDDVLVSFVEATHIASDAPDHAMDQWKRFVFAKRNKMDFVIYEYTLALRVKKQSAVVRQKCALGNHIRRVHRRFPFDSPCEEWVAKLDCQRRGYLCELRIFKREWSGRFRPNKQVQFLDGGSEADSCDLLEVRCVNTEPIRGI